MALQLSHVDFFEHVLRDRFYSHVAIPVGWLLHYRIQKDMLLPQLLLVTLALVDIYVVLLLAKLHIFVKGLLRFVLLTLLHERPRGALHILINVVEHGELAVFDQRCCALHLLTLSQLV